jgi:hypothetical protein
MTQIHTDKGPEGTGDEDPGKNVSGPGGMGEFARLRVRCLSPAPGVLLPATCKKNFDVKEFFEYGSLDVLVTVV